MIAQFTGRVPSAVHAGVRVGELNLMYVSDGVFDGDDGVHLDVVILMEFILMLFILMLFILMEFILMLFIFMLFILMLFILMFSS